MREGCAPIAGVRAPSQSKLRRRAIHARKLAIRRPGLAEIVRSVEAQVGFTAIQVSRRGSWTRMKHRIVHIVQKYLLNPPIKFLFAIGLAPPGYALLETTGRKTGKLRRTPVGNGLVGRHFWLVAEHGTKAGYVRNIADNPRVRLKLREGLGARWRSGTAELLYLDDPRERQRWLAKQVPKSGRNAAAVRFFGTDLLTIRIDLDS